jgi:hypothetical protein
MFANPTSIVDALREYCVNREFKHGPFENVRENWKGNEE